jgi:hypothetical protein
MQHLMRPVLQVPPQLQLAQEAAVELADGQVSSGKVARGHVAVLLLPLLLLQMILAAGTSLRSAAGTLCLMSSR